MKRNKNKISKKTGLLYSAIALAIACSIQENGSATTMVNSIAVMNAAAEIENEAAFFEKENSGQGLVLGEKAAVDPDYVFETLDKTMYATRIVDCKVEPKDYCDTLGCIDKGSEVLALGRNQNGYLKILLDGQEVYVEEEYMSEDAGDVYEDVDYTLYAPGEIELYEDASTDNALSELDKYDEIEVIGENEGSYLLVKHGDLEGYVMKDGLLEYLPQEAYIVTADDGVTTYYTNNMYDGVLADVPDSEKTEANLQLLAKLIHCEAGAQTEAGKLAVATVVVNRLYDGYWGSTVESVIKAAGQFTPVSSGKIYSTSYTESDYECAKKVLVEGYRSFPAYVLYFQSMKDGAFGGSTYCICKTTDGTWPQYFSYKASDLQKYGTSTLLEGTEVTEDESAADAYADDSEIAIDEETMIDAEEGIESLDAEIM